MRSHPVFTFVKHYFEMVLVMLVGMFVLGGLLLGLAAALGFGRAQLEADAPAVILAGMGLAMTAPMVWWMHHRGHSTAANASMAMAMAGPAVVSIVLLGTGLVTDLHALLMIEHIAMGPAMLVAMLLYRGEYTHSHHPLPS